MSNQFADVTSDDKLWSLLSYIFSPLVPIIALLIEDKKKRPYIKFHSVQALVLGIVEFLLYIVLSWVFGLGFCLGLLLWFYMIYVGVKAYQGESVKVPVVTDFVKKQGWA